MITKTITRDEFFVELFINLKNEVTQIIATLDTVPRALQQQDVFRRSASATLRGLWSRGIDVQGLEDAASVAEQFRNRGKTPVFVGWHELVQRARAIFEGRLRERVEQRTLDDVVGIFSGTGSDSSFSVESLMTAINEQVDLSKRLFQNKLNMLKALDVTIMAQTKTDNTLSGTPVFGHTLSTINSAVSKTSPADKKLSSGWPREYAGSQLSESERGSLGTAASFTGLELDPSCVELLLGHSTGGNTILAEDAFALVCDGFMSQLRDTGLIAASRDVAQLTTTFHWNKEQPRGSDATWMATDAASVVISLTTLDAYT